MLDSLESRVAREARHRGEWDEAVAGLGPDPTGLLAFLVSHTHPSTRVYSWSVETVASFMNPLSGPLWVPLSGGGGGDADAASARALASVERAAVECNRWCTSRGGKVNIFRHGGPWYAGLEVRRPHYDDDLNAGCNLTV